MTKDKAAAEQELPEDFTSAWASVLLDVFEKQKRERSDSGKPDEPPETKGKAE